LQFLEQANVSTLGARSGSYACLHMDVFEIRGCDPNTRIGGTNPLFNDGFGMLPIAY
jgi:hypothetical protein